MAEKEPTRPEAKQLREKIISLTNVDWVTPALNEDFGALKFTDVVPTLNAAAELIEALEKTDQNLLPVQRLNNISSYRPTYLRF